MILVGVLWAGATLLVGGELVRFVVSPTEPERDGELEDFEAEVAEHEGGEEGEEVAVVTDAAEEERALAREASLALGLSAGSLSLSLLGFIIPGARLLSVPMLLGGMAPTALRAGGTLVDERRLDFGGLTTIGAGLEVALGYYSLASFSWLVFAIGERLQLRARNRVLAELEQVMKNIDERAWVQREGVEIEVPLEHIRNNDLVIVRAGDIVPVDGLIVEGRVIVDEHVITGEASRSERGAGDILLATSMLVEGDARMRPRRTGSETVASRLMQLRSRSRSYEQGIRTRASLEGDRSVSSTLGMMAIGWARGRLPGMLAGFWTNGVELSWFGAPYSATNTIEAAAQRSIIIKDGRSLELLATVDTVVLSKTGTLHDFRVGELRVPSTRDALELLGLCAALEGCCEDHTIARAILAEAARLDAPAYELEQRALRVGAGVEGRFAEQELLLGSVELFEHEGVELDDPELRTWGAAAQARGHTLVHLSVDRRWAGTVELVPQMRERAAASLAHLRERGLELILLSGERGPSVSACATQLELKSAEGRPLPEDKHAFIRELQAQGRSVCFVGQEAADGPAMRAANVSLALEGASPVAIHCAQIFVRSEDLSLLELLFELRERFAFEQLAIVGVGRMITLASGLSFLVLGASLPVLVWFYMLGLSTIVVVSKLSAVRLGRVEALSEPVPGDR